MGIELILGAVVLAVVLLIVITVTVKSLLKHVNPNEAHVIVGMKSNEKEKLSDRVAKVKSDGSVETDENGEIVYEAVDMNKFSKARVIIGDRYWKIPFLYSVTEINLEQRSTEFHVSAQSREYVNTEVKVNVQFRIQNDPQAVRRAAARFSSQQKAGVMEKIISDAMEGHIRSVIGSMSVTELITDREGFKKNILDSVEKDFIQQGISIDTLNVKGIESPGTTYIDDLAEPERAKVSREAAIATQNAKLEISQNASQTDQKAAEAKKEFEVNQSEYIRQQDEARIAAETTPRVMQAQKDREVAEIQRETEEAKARSEAARLEATIVAKARAEADIAAAEADGERRSRESRANAEFYEESKKAEAVKLAANADAEAIRSKGQAEADAVEANAKAADEYTENALVVRILDILPELVREANAPLSNVDEITILQNGSNNGEGLGGSLTSNLPGTMANLDKVFQHLNLDFGKLLNGYTAKEGPGSKDDLIGEVLNGETENK